MAVNNIPFKYYGNAPSSSRAGAKIKYIVVHWTANTSKGANAEMHHKFYSNQKNGVSAHYTTDSTRIVQSVGDSRAAWTVGQTVRGTVNYGALDGSSYPDLVTNQNTINIEMCVNSDGDWTRTRKITLELVKNLMKRFNIKPTHVIRHYDALRSGNWRKNCPGNMRKNNWADWWKFKEELKQPIELKFDLTKSSVGVLVGSKDSTEVPKQEIKGTPIKGKATTTVKSMQDWAKSKNADPIFIELAQKFYDISVQYGIDPAVTYAQSAKETGFMRFGGVLDKTFYNPCGLKTTEGGGNSDPNAHQRFKNWDEGITAQVQHLGLYAGEIYKRDDIVDPRHFPEIRGTAPTVEKLGGKWAPSASYGSEIVDLMKQFASAETTTVNKDIIDLEDYKVVISLLSEADIEAGRELARAFNAAITFSGDIDYYPLKKEGKKIIAVGGTKANHTSYLDVIIAGLNRNETLQKVKAYIKEVKK